MINLELYRVFVVVADQASITKASNLLNISQPLVTKHIKNLEKILGIRLFKKTNNVLALTETGDELYKKLKGPINELIYIDNHFNSIKNINIGSHKHLLNKIFGKCLNRFYLEYPKVNLNFKNFETDEMLNMLNNKDLDIVFSKKVDTINHENINYIKLGYLNDIFIVNKSSNWANKTINIDDLKNQIIYLPNAHSQTVTTFLSLIDIPESNLKCSSYSTLLDSVSSSFEIGLVTKEYLSKGILKKYDLIELETDLNLEPVEFGIYFLSNNRFKELNDLIQIIKTHFFFRDF